MVESGTVDDAPISVRMPESKPADSETHLNEAGYANLSRQSLFNLFGSNPDQLRKLRVLFEPEQEK